METHQIIIDWATVAVTLLGAGLVYWGLRDSANARKEQNAIMRKTETLRMLLETLKQRATSGLALPLDGDREGIAARIEIAHGNGPDSVKAAAAIRQYLNYWETLAGGVRDGVLDEDLLRMQARGRIVSLWQNYFPFVAERRRISRVPTLWAEVENLATKWGATTPDVIGSPRGEPTRRPAIDEPRKEATEPPRLP